VSKLLIGHLWVPPGLCVKMRLSAQPLKWKWFFILMQIKLIFTRQVAHLASFWKWGFWNSAVAYCLWHWCHKQYKGCGSARVGGSGVNELTRQEFSSTSHPLRHLGVTCFRSRVGGGVEVSDSWAYYNQANSTIYTYSYIILLWVDMPVLLHLHLYKCSYVINALLAYVYESTIYTKCTP